jgi:hypothetical protein
VAGNAGRPRTEDRAPTPDLDWARHAGVRPHRKEDEVELIAPVGANRARNEVVS